MTWRKYPINEQFFNEIDSEEKAYFLGILYADGTNSTNKTEVSLRLQEDDRELLIDLNNLLQPTKPVLPIISKNKKHKTLYRLIINSKKISNKLNELGVVPNKTFKIMYPTWLNKNLENHFIRGYFDGDGYIGYNIANNESQFCITGTENIILNIQNILINKSDLNKTKLQTRHPERKNNIRMLMYSGNGNSKKLYYYLYNDANLYMKRKKNKFESILKLN